VSGHVAAQQDTAHSSLLLVSMHSATHAPIMYCSCDDMQQQCEHCVYCCWPAWSSPVQNTWIDLRAGPVPKFLSVDQRVC
jgi:hypothetical protein